MTSPDDVTRPARRPALVDELERMGFAPADLRPAQREPAAPDDLRLAQREPAAPDDLRLAQREPAAPDDLRLAQREPAAPDEAVAGQQLPPLRPPYDQLAALQDDREPPVRRAAARAEPVRRPATSPPAGDPDPALKTWARDRAVPEMPVPEPAVPEPTPSAGGSAPLEPFEHRAAARIGAGDQGSSQLAEAHGASGPSARYELTADTVVRGPAQAPSGGWRRAVFTGTFGLVRPGPSAAEQRERDLVARATRPVPGCWRVAVLSLKGGVGKTTTTAALGVQLATLRGDRVIAVDANPDRGTLVEKVPQVNPATVRDLLQGREQIRRYSDVRAYTSLSPSRLEVLASDADPTASQAFSEADYRSALSVLEHFYSVILTDCGTGLLHSAMSGVLGLADALVLVTSATLDGARSASATLDWLEAHGLAGLVRESVAVVSSVRPRGGYVDVRAVHEHFAQRCRAVVEVPFDRHLETGSVVDLAAMAAPTRYAYLRLAAAVGDGLP